MSQTPQALQDFLDALAALHEQHGLEWDESLYKPAEGWELASMEDSATRIPLVINVEEAPHTHAQGVREASRAASLTIPEWPANLASEHPAFLEDLADLIDEHADRISVAVNTSLGAWHPGRKYNVADHIHYYQEGIRSWDGRIAYHRFFEMLAEAGIPGLCQCR